MKILDSTLGTQKANCKADLTNTAAYLSKLGSQRLFNFSDTLREVCGLLVQTLRLTNPKMTGEINISVLYLCVIKKNCLK